MKNNKVLTEDARAAHTNIVNMVKFISFIGFTAVSLVLSTNMYLSMTDRLFDKLLLGAVNLSIEAFKTYSIIMRNTYLYFSRVGHDLYSRRELKIKAFKNFIIYLLMAAVSIVASFGFTLSTVDRFNTKQDTQLNYTIQIESAQDMVEAYEEQISAYDTQIETLQRNASEMPEDFATRKQQMFNQVNEYVEKRDLIVSKQNDEKFKIQEYKLAEKTARGETSRSMFDLIGEILEVSPALIMLLLLGSAAFLIELGAFTTAPQTYALDRPRDLPQENKTPEPKSKPTAQIRKPAKQKPKQKKPAARTKKKPEEKTIPTKEVPKAEVSTPQEKRAQPTKKSKHENFIHALYNNDNHVYLKEREVAAEEAGLTKTEALEFFKKLTTLKGPTNYPLIEFRKHTSKWHPNYTSEVLIMFLKQEGHIT